MFVQLITALIIFLGLHVPAPQQPAAPPDPPRIRHHLQRVPEPPRIIRRHLATQR